MTHKLPKKSRQPPHLHARGTKTMNKTHSTRDEALPSRRTLILNEGAGRERTLARFLPRRAEAILLWANNRAGHQLRSLPVVRGVRVGLHTEPCGCKLQGRDRVKNKAFWQPCQPPAYFPGDVTTDVGLYPWASAFGSVPPTTYGTACDLVEYSIHFQTKRRQNLLGQFGRLA